MILKLKRKDRKFIESVNYFLEYTPQTLTGSLKNNLLYLTHSNHKLHNPLYNALRFLYIDTQYSEVQLIFYFANTHTIHMTLLLLHNSNFHYNNYLYFGDNPDGLFAQLSIFLAQQFIFVGYYFFSLRYFMLVHTADLHSSPIPSFISSLILRSQPSSLLYASRYFTDCLTSYQTSCHWSWCYHLLYEYYSIILLSSLLNTYESIFFIYTMDVYNLWSLFHSQALPSKPLS